MGESTAAGLFRAKVEPYLPAPGSRYRKPDLVAQLPRAIAILAWGSAAVAVMFYDKAQPRRYGLDRFFNVYRRGEGESSMETAAYLTVVALLLAVLGLLVNTRRMRRSGDHYNRSLLVLVALSLLSLAHFALR